jgi:hypothetical protein
MLPTSPTPKRLSLTEHSILCYGPPKIGKSTFASGADSPIFLATEPGLAALEVFQVPVTSWNEFLAAVVALKNDKHSFKTVVVDTLDNAYRFCSEAICKKAGHSHESDFGHGKGWALVSNEFHRAILQLAQLPMGLILISHSREKEVDTPIGKIQKTVPTLPPRVMESIAGFVSIILYATTVRQQTKEGVTWERVCLSEPRREHEAGDRTGLLPPQFSLNYSEFKSYFEKGKTK